MAGPYYKMSFREQCCVGCLSCIDICPEGALAFKGDGSANAEEMQKQYDSLTPLKGTPVQIRNCTGVEACIVLCPKDCISVVEIDKELDYERGNFFVPKQHQ